VNFLARRAACRARNCPASLWRNWIAAILAALAVAIDRSGHFCGGQLGAQMRKGSISPSLFKALRRIDIIHRSRWPRTR
jgi:hypothetical protein